MKLSRKLVFCMMAVLLLVPAAAFAAGQGEEAVAEEEYEFFVITHGGAADPFWAVVVRGAEDAAEQFGVDMTYLGPEQYDVGEFVDMIETAIAADPDGIVVTITDKSAVDEPLRNAIDEEIPVVAINVPDDRDPGEKIPYLAYVGADEYQVGVEAARRMFEEFEDTPERGVVLIHEPGHAGHEARSAGMQEVFDEHDVPFERLSGSPDAADNFEALSSYLTSNPETDAVFTLGPLGAHPALSLMEDLGDDAEDIKLGAVDLSDQIISAIEDGRMVFTIEQQQYLQGYLPIGLLTLYNQYGLIPHDDILTGPAIVDEDNVDVVEEMVEAGYR
ncbi:MAG: sugar ABC transporter substrate-binding protein [Spirochaetaceae bacterium]